MLVFTRRRFVEVLIDDEVTERASSNQAVLHYVLTPFLVDIARVHPQRIHPHQIEVRPADLDNPPGLPFVARYCFAGDLMHDRDKILRFEVQGCVRNLQLIDLNFRNALRAYLVHRLVTRFENVSVSQGVMLSNPILIQQASYNVRVFIESLDRAELLGHNLRVLFDENLPVKFEQDVRTYRNVRRHRQVALAGRELDRLEQRLRRADSASNDERDTSFKQGLGGKVGGRAGHRRREVQNSRDGVLAIDECDETVEPSVALHVFEHALTAEERRPDGD